MALNPIKEVLRRNPNILDNPAKFSALLKKEMPDQELEHSLIVLALEEGIPERLQYDWRRNKNEYVRIISDMSGCSRKMARQIADLWMEAIPYEELTMGKLSIPFEDKLDDILPGEDGVLGESDIFPDMRDVPLIDGREDIWPFEEGSPDSNDFGKDEEYGVPELPLEEYEVVSFHAPTHL